MKKEIERIRPQLTAVGQNIDQIIEKFANQGEPAEGRRLQFRYLCSPTRVIANDRGGVAALEVEENELVLQDGRTVAKGTDKHAQIEVDCVIYAIGDQVDASLGLPFSRGVFVTNPGKVLADPDPAAYQPYDPEAARVLDGIYVAGWSRNASVGLVGVAKQDAERGMKVVNAYLSAKEGFTPGEMEAKIEAILDILDKKGVAVVTREDIEILESVEHEEARKRKTWDFKFTSDDQMLQVIRERKAAR
jgi:ferredoxin--NADP+ reductase